MSPGVRPKASAIARMFSPTGRSRSIFPRARGPTAILRMYMSGTVSSDPCSPATIIDIAPLPPRATSAPPPSSGTSARSAGRPPPPSRSGASTSSSGPITTSPSTGSPASACTIPSIAASFAPAASPRPSQRAPASAARSVARA